MSDLRALLYDTWCTKCGKVRDMGCVDLEHSEHARSPLATRLPECVPPGLEWKVCLNGVGEWALSGLFTDAATAELLFIGQAVLSIAESGWVLDYSLDGWNVFGWGIDEDKSQSNGHHKTAIAALAAALHNSADERDAEQ